MILLYLPLLAVIHFSSGAALGGMAVLSAKALADMRREGRVRASGVPGRAGKATSHAGSVQEVYPARDILPSPRQEGAMPISDE